MKNLLIDLSILSILSGGTGQTQVEIILFGRIGSVIALISPSA
jgi:hypothetical protein